MADHSASFISLHSRALRPLVALVALFLVASGCTSPSDDDEPAAAASTTTTTSVVETATSTTSTTALPPLATAAPLLDTTDQPVQLKGVARSGAEYACIQGWGIFDSDVPNDLIGDSDAELAAMAASGVTAVKVMLNEQCWLGEAIVPQLREIVVVPNVVTLEQITGIAYQQAVINYVRRVQAFGMTALIDLAWSAPPGELALGQAPMPNTSYSVAFWASAASVFKDDPNVMFYLYNEPHDMDDWACWRDGCTMEDGWQAAGMQQLIDAVRLTGARQTVIAPGLEFANDLSGWLEHQPLDPAGKLAAAFHVYDFNACSDPACWEATVGLVARDFPIVSGEFGESPCTDGFAESWLDWADPVGISYLAWAWNDWTVTGCDYGDAKILLRSHDGTPTDYGAAYFARLR